MSYIVSVRGYISLYPDRVVFFEKKENGK